MSGSSARRFDGTPRPAEIDMRSLLDELIREVSGDGVRLDANFFEAGLTSAALIRVHERLLTRLGRPLPVSVLFKYPNRRALAAYLADPHDQGGAQVAALDPDAVTPPSDLLELRRQLRHRIRRKAGEA